MFLCLFWCFRSDLEDNGRKELKWVKKRAKLAKIYEADRFWADWSTQPIDPFGQKLSAAALAFGKLKAVSFFS